MNRSALVSAVASMLLGHDAMGQERRLTPTVGMDLADQQGGAQERNGLGANASLWYAINPFLSARVEAMGAVFPWRATDMSYPGGTTPVDGFATLVGAGADVVVRLANSRNAGPFLTTGWVALRGTGAEARAERSTVVRSYGAGLSLGPRWLVEVRYLHRRLWADAEFEVIRLGLARWLR